MDTEANRVRCEANELDIGATCLDTRYKDKGLNSEAEWTWRLAEAGGEKKEKQPKLQQSPKLHVKNAGLLYHPTPPVPSLDLSLVLLIPLTTTTTTTTTPSANTRTYGSGNPRRIKLAESNLPLTTCSQT
ncbi:hypothetical protein C0Q70_14006 [Pomacea canaliculata]|uniref:Uncharacterized protein n=1 Tax=Pomacea canaliculata TaxID=400727 RepID=A0A2T7NYT0_POMCA|nr:hypothetical protein C0Q70_14006 [Pomacea canaliculata]